MKWAQRGVVCAMSWVSSDGWEAAGGKSHKALRSSLNCALQAPLSDVPTVLPAWIVVVWNCYYYFLFIIKVRSVKAQLILWGYFRPFLRYASACCI